MKTIKFKTTIKCSGCLAKVTPFLNEENTIHKWEVDIDNPDKVLTVVSNETDTDKVIQAVEKAGFKIEQIKN